MNRRTAIVNTLLASACLYMGNEILSDNTRVKGLSRVDCSSNPLDLRPVVNQTIDWVSNWMENPRNKERKLVVAFGEGHSIPTNTTLPLATINDFIHRYPAERFNVGLEKCSNHLDQSYGMKSGGCFGFWDRHHNNNQWALLNILALQTSKEGPVSFNNFMASSLEWSKKGIPVWFNDAAMDYSSTTLLPDEDPVTRAVMNEEGVVANTSISSIGPLGWDIRNKVMCRNIVQQFSINAGARVSFNCFGASHLFGLNPRLFDRYLPEFPYKNSIYDIFNSASLAEEYDVLTVFFTSRNFNTGKLHAEAEQAIEYNSARNGMPSGIYGVDINETGFVHANGFDRSLYEKETQILAEIYNSSDIQSPIYEVDQAYYRKVLERNEVEWQKMCF